MRNSMRLIDADEVVSALRCCNRSKGHRCSECPVFSRYEHRICKATVDRFAADMIESLQAQLNDVAPVVRGEWRWHEEWRESTSDGPAECQSAGYVCSACGIELSEYLSESLGEIIYADNPEETPKITFCPNCGAKMESEGST